MNQRIGAQLNINHFAGGAKELAAVLAGPELEAFLRQEVETIGALLKVIGLLK